MSKGNAMVADQTTAIAEVERLARDHSLQALGQAGKMERAIRMAQGIEQLRKALDPLMPSIMLLQNCKLGFLTDRDPKKGSTKGPYSVAEVRDCVLEALLRGLNLTGNEFNIISGSCYTTKEGLSRLVGELPGLTRLRIAPGIPKLSEGGATIRVLASWKLNGQDQCLTDEQGVPGRTFAIRLNAGMGADAVIGKATRKALAAIYAQVTGSVHPDGEADDGPDRIEGPGGTGTSRVLQRLGATSPAQTTPPVGAEAEASPVQ